MADVHTNWEQTVFAQQPGLATERFAKPQTSAGEGQLASEQFMGVQPLGQIIKAVVNGQVMEFLRGGPLLMLEGNNLQIAGLVSSGLPQANLAKGRQKRIQDFASAVYQDWLVIVPLVQICYLGTDNHLHLINFPASPSGQPACLLFRPDPAGTHGQLAISAPGGFLRQ